MLPEHQIHGHGRRLMAHAEAVAVELSLDLLRLYTNQRFAANIALYRRFGYVVDREEVVAAGTMVHLRAA